MLDINDIEIKEGDLIKQVGMVTYADGPKLKYSKQTWLVIMQDGELVLPVKSNDIKFVIVGNQEAGLRPEFLPFQEGVITIDEGTVPVNYKILKDVPTRGWKAGEVVKIVGKVSRETLENGVLEQCSDDEPNQHMLVVVDPIKLTGLFNKTNG